MDVDVHKEVELPNVQMEIGVSGWNEDEYVDQGVWEDQVVGGEGVIPIFPIHVFQYQ